MTILQVITKNELGGAQSVVAHLANELSKEHRIIVAAGEGDGKFFSLLLPSIETIRIRHLYRRISPVNDVKAIIELRRINHKYHPDVIHLHSTKAGLVGRIALPRKKIVYTVHGFDSVRVSFRMLLPVEKAMQRFCAYIVGVSKYDERNLLSENITRHVTCVYNGIPKPKYEENITWNIPSSFQKKVLCIARVSPQKNLQLFFEIADKLPEFAFVWIGNQYKIESHPDNVFFLGNIPNAGKYCRLADIFVLTSNYEGLPMVIIEAMAYGKPVVASDVGGISEIVRNGVNGYVLNNQAELFVEKIREILLDKDKTEKFSANSLKIFEEELSVDKMVRGYLQLYQTI